MLLFAPDRLCCSSNTSCRFQNLPSGTFTRSPIQSPIEAPEPLLSSFFDPPDSPICQDGLSFIGDFLVPWAANHSFRTYAFALAIAHYAGWDEGAEAGDLGFDKEQIFLACALHEMGFDQKQASYSRLSLELWGGIKAREWILSQRPKFIEVEGRTETSLVDLADEACEAIARHSVEFRGFSSRVRLTGALVALGAGQDLMASSCDFLHAETIKVICERWRRLGYCHGLNEVTDGEVKKPACLFEDCRRFFEPAMYEVDCYQDIQGELVPVSDELLRRNSALKLL